MDHKEACEVALQRSISPVWREVGATFFRQGFQWGYHWARDELKWKLLREIPAYVGAGFLAGFIIGRVLEL